MSDLELVKKELAKLGIAPAGAQPVAKVTTSGYDPRLYQMQKASGERLANGLLPLKRLTARHVRILVLHLSGLKGNDIARICRIRPVTVSRVLNDPLGRTFLKRHYDDLENEFQALLGPAIGTLRDSLEKGVPMKERLRGADTFFKRRGDYKETVEKKDTAEDVVQKILSGLQINVQVNTGGDK